MKLLWSAEHDDTWILEERQLYIAESADRCYVARCFNPETCNYPKSELPLDYRDGVVWGLHVIGSTDRQPGSGPDRVFSELHDAQRAAQEIEDAPSE